MNPEKNAVNKESAKKSYFAPPAVELLLGPDQREAAWPKNITDNEVFRTQIEERQTLIHRIDEVISRLPRPDISLRQAISDGLITEKQVADLYESLSDLLENKDYRRVLLYIPFEFLPSAGRKTNSKTLKRSAERFTSAYMTAWRAQLQTHDVRANFVDGDVLEVESRTGDLPRVVKAAHLIPKLVELGFIQPTAAIKLREATGDPVLKESIDDALLVLVDMGVIAETDLTRMHIPTERPEGNAAADSPITKNRAIWLEQEKKKLAIRSAARDITGMVLGKTFSDEAATRLLNKDTTPEDQQTFIVGVDNAIESLANSDIEEAKQLYARHQATLLGLWRTEVQETREALSTTFYRLYALGIVKNEQFVALNLPTPSLAGPFSENLIAAAEEMAELKNIVASIESDPEILHYVYPAVLISGSRLKGYGTANADIDVSVFVKPNIPSADRAKLQEILKKKFAHEKMRGEVVEFWLEETPTGLSVCDFEETSVLLGESYWTHVLFGGAWEGNKETISELRRKLLVPYFYDTEKMIHGRSARGLYLEELERDTLQYRLMHKGYARFFPPYGGIHTSHSDRIDGESMFWDSGYRQTALKLFASHVFLPKLPAEIK